MSDKSLHEGQMPWFINGTGPFNIVHKSDKYANSLHGFKQWDFNFYLIVYNEFVLF